MPLFVYPSAERETRVGSRNWLGKLIYVVAKVDSVVNDDPKMRSSSRTEINKRFSFPMACIVFALVGVPLGITAHRRETSFGFAASLVVGVFYFLFIIVADTLRTNPRLHPELLVWFPNLLFLVLGIWMFRRLSRQ